MTNRTTIFQQTAFQCDMPENLCVDAGLRACLMLMLAVLKVVLWVNLRNVINNL